MIAKRKWEINNHFYEESSLAKKLTDFLKPTTFNTNCSCLLIGGDREIKLFASTEEKVKLMNLEKNVEYLIQGDDNKVTFQTNRKNYAYCPLDNLAEEKQELIEFFKDVRIFFNEIKHKNGSMKLDNEEVCYKYQAIQKKYFVGFKMKINLKIHKFFKVNFKKFEKKINQDYKYFFVVFDVKYFIDEPSDSKYIFASWNVIEVPYCSKCLNLLAVRKHYVCGECFPMKGFCNECIGKENEEHQHALIMIYPEASFKKKKCIFEYSSKLKQKRLKDYLVNFHYGIICNICRDSIFGIRYKCAKCLDFDICQKCLDEFENYINPNTKEKIKAIAKTDCHKMETHCYIRIIYDGFVKI